MAAVNAITDMTATWKGLAKAELTVAAWTRLVQLLTAKIVFPELYSQTMMIPATLTRAVT